MFFGLWIKLKVIFKNLEWIGKIIMKNIIKYCSGMCIRMWFLSVLGKFIVFKIDDEWVYDLNM